MGVDTHWSVNGLGSGVRIHAHCGEVHLCSPGLCWFFCLLLMVYPSNIKTPITAVCSGRSMPVPYLSVNFRFDIFEQIHILV
ncbi:hypothetical protein BV20DRAFT_1053597 [Pilatotrama ljubarskyi]|nr:hypothetical protein BV20DRAFT_1053597 [Pilatotrama ljubarskyi]